MSADRIESTAWREPTRSLPLVWGRYDDRLAWGLILIVAGAVGLQASSTWANSFLLQGAVVHVIGWSILPARGWRRLVAVVPSTGNLWILLTGPLSLWTLIVPYLGWLLVRHRPLRSYLTIVFPLAAGTVLPNFFAEYSGMLPAAAIAFGVLVGSAWIARYLATTKRPNPLPSPSDDR